MEKDKFFDNPKFANELISRIQEYEQSNMNNVLIIGNGFDRQLGLKTDYISFLDWVESLNIYYESKIIKAVSDFSIVIDYVSNKQNLDKVNNWEQIIDFILSNNDNIRWDQYGISFENAENKFTKDEIETLKYLSLNNSKILEVKESKSNVWFSYFNYIRKNNKNKIAFSFKNLINENGNWIDLEGLIHKIISKSISGKFSDLERIINLNSEKADKNYDIIFIHFEHLKKLLTEYLQLQIQQLPGNNLEIDIDEIKDVNTIINFNYTDTTKYLNNSNSNYKVEENNIYHVHGSIKDSNKIVFGADIYSKEDYQLPNRSNKSISEIRIFSDKNLFSYSKLFQLLQLQIKKPKFNIKIIDKIYILGHSIGEQDYSYYFSIIDNNYNNIEIEYLWYEFNNKSNNYHEGQEALFNMLFAYEKYSSKRVFHKMIFEGRIKFKEVNIPKIV